MRAISSLARAIQEDCDQRLGLMQLFALVWEDRRCPPENVLWGRRRLWKDWGERLEPTKQSRQLRISISRNRLQQKEFYFPGTDPMHVSTALVLTLVAYLDYHRDFLLVVRLQDFLVLGVCREYVGTSLTLRRYIEPLSSTKIRKRETGVT
jgi:hypothetical protein